MSSDKNAGRGTTSTSPTIWQALPGLYQEEAARHMMSVGIASSVTGIDDLATGTAYYAARFYLDFPLDDLDRPTFGLLTQVGGWAEDILGTVRVPVGGATAMVMDLSCEPGDVLPYLDQDQHGLPELGFTMLSLRQAALDELRNDDGSMSRFVEPETYCEAMVLLEQAYVPPMWRGAELRLAGLGMTLQALGQGKRVAAVEPSSIDPDDRRSSVKRDLRRLGFRQRAPQVMTMQPDPVDLYSLLNACLPG